MYEKYQCFFANFIRFLTEGGVLNFLMLFLLSPINI